MNDNVAICDEELLKRIKNGDSSAEELLINGYLNTVRVCTRPFFLMGGDNEDLIQEGLLGLLSAIRNYDSSKEVAFDPYAVRCIKNNLISAVKTYSRKKHQPLNDGVSLEYILSEESKPNVQQEARSFRRIPEDLILARESEEEFYSTISRHLSDYENEILVLYLDGFSYASIAETLGKQIKSIDNAVQRIRRKLARQFQP